MFRVEKAHKTSALYTSEHVFNTNKLHQKLP